MKKILYLTSHDLNAADYGAVLRARHTAQMLAQYGEVGVVLGSRHKDVLKNAFASQAGFELLHKIHFTPTQYSFLRRQRQKLDRYFIDIEGCQTAPADCLKLKSLMGEHDLTWIHGLETASRFDIWRWPATVLDVDDIPSSLYRLRLSQSKNLYDKYWNMRQMLLWRRNEKQLSERFDAICVCSKLDRGLLGGGDKVYVLPNGFDAPRQNAIRHPVNPPQIGFVGTFIYWANCDGVRWFINHVWPRILEKVPQARLRLAGERGESLFGGQNIDALGWVPDMEQEMANWSLSIVPVLAGGGTRIKILEAFSRKCPVVSTSLGAYGHDVQHERQLLISDSATGFAENCLRLLEQPAEGEWLAKNAWESFLRTGKWDNQAKCISHIVEKIAGSAPQYEKHEFPLDSKVAPKSTVGPKLGVQWP